MGSLTCADLITCWPKSTAGLNCSSLDQRQLHENNSERNSNIGSWLHDLVDETVSESHKILRDSQNRDWRFELALIGPAWRCSGNDQLKHLVPEPPLL